jgi:hypothetical protein
MNASSPVAGLGKLLVAAGMAIVVAGLLIMALSKLGPGWRLPGDIFIQNKNFTLYFPIATMLLLSVILTVVLNLFLRR